MTELKRESVSVVMPSYNERENIAEAIRRIISALGSSLLEIIVVDDDSPDRTWEVVERLKESRCRLIRRLNRRGLASALSEGTRLAQGEIVVWLDCDLGISPEDMLRLVERLDEYDIAIGSRYVPGGEDRRSKFRAFLSRLFNDYARFILGNYFRDWTSGFAAARRQALVALPLSDQGFGEYFIEWVYRAHQRDLKIIEVGYSYGYRKSGVSKTDGNWLRFFQLSLNYTGRVLWTRWKF